MWQQLTWDLSCTRCRQVFEHASSHLSCVHFAGACCSCRSTFSPPDPILFLFLPRLDRSTLSKSRNRTKICKTCGKEKGKLKWWSGFKGQTLQKVQKRYGIVNISTTYRGLFNFDAEFGFTTDKLNGFKLIVAKSVLLVQTFILPNMLCRNFDANYNRKIPWTERKIGTDTLQCRLKVDPPYFLLFLRLFV